MPEVLDRIRQDINVRLAELRPLVDEHTRLEAALQALSDVRGRTPVPASPVSAGQPQPRATKTTPAAARKRAPRGANRAAVLEAAENRPGATSAELAAASGVQRNTLNALLARLVKSGELRTEALPTGRTGYVLARAQPQASAGAPAAAGGDAA